jgi:hypothetical protein
MNEHTFPKEKNTKRTASAIRLHGVLAGIHRLVSLLLVHAVARQQPMVFEQSEQAMQEGTGKAP